MCATRSPSLHGSRVYDFWLYVNPYFHVHEMFNTYDNQGHAHIKLRHLMHNADLRTSLDIGFLLQGLWTQCCLFNEQFASPVVSGGRMLFTRSQTLGTREAQ